MNATAASLHMDKLRAIFAEHGENINHISRNRASNVTVRSLHSPKLPASRTRSALTC